MDATVGDHLRAGAAVYAAGRYHAAHDAWEERWLDESGPTADLLQGLIQLSAAVHHARERNREGATGLAASAGEYLDAGAAAAAADAVNLEAVRRYLATLASDPAVIERRPPVPLLIDGEAVALADLRFPAAGIAARAVAEDRGDEAVVEPAVAYAEADLDDEEVSSPFVTLVLDYLTAGGAETGLILQRLEGHVGRRQHRESDVDGLFDP